jgi:hypothetical protein
MPDVRDNRLTWNAPSSWSAQGDEWSGPWGGTEQMWHGTLLPRLHAFKPIGTNPIRNATRTIAAKIAIRFTRGSV